jgi:hypothetical protein
LKEAAQLKIYLQNKPLPLIIFVLIHYINYFINDKKPQESTKMKSILSPFFMAFKSQVRRYTTPLHSIHVDGLKEQSPISLA